MVGYGVTLTVLPYFAARIHRLAGVDDDSLAMHVGVLTGVYALAQLVGGPAIGRLTDRWGRRPTALVGLIGVGITQIAFGLVSSLWWLYGLRLVGGIAASLFTVAATTMVADWTDEASRLRGMARFGAAVSLGVVAGPLLGAVLNGVSLQLLGWDLDGYSLPFVIVGASTLVIAAVLGWYVEESGDPAGRAAATRRFPRAALSALGLTLAAQFGLALFESTFVLYSRQRLAFTPGQTTQVFLVCGVVMAVLQLAAGGPLVSAVSPLAQIGVGFIGMAVGVAGLLAADSLAPVLVAVAVLAAGTALITPNVATLVADRADGALGLSFGMKSTASSVGQFLGPVVGGGLLAWRVTMPYAATAFLLGAIGVSTLARRAAPGRAGRLRKNP